MITPHAIRVTVWVSVKTYRVLSNRPDQFYVPAKYRSRVHMEKNEDRRFIPVTYFPSRGEYEDLSRSAKEQDKTYSEVFETLYQGVGEILQSLETAQQKEKQGQGLTFIREPIQTK